MPEHSLFPGYVRLDYHSAWGRHVALFPTRAWNAASGTGVMGSYTDWLGAPTDAEGMIDDLVAKLAPFYLPTASLDIATIYSIAAVGDPAIAKKSKSYGTVGTSVSTNHAKAAQITWTLRDSEFNLARIVQLDAPTGTGWEPVTGLPSSGPVFDLFVAISSDNKAWSSRAGLQIQTFSKIAYDLSDKLRREYGMV